jgi:hypothetical protein
MKTLMLTLIALTASSTFAIANEASELKLVRQLADRKVSGSDVKKSVAKYENTDNNPCAPEGVSYTVSVSVRKWMPGLDKDGNPAPKRVWNEVTDYFISRADLLRGADLSQNVCME